MVVVDIALALICFSAQADGPLTCQNALIGGDTPKGTYQLQQRLVQDPLYGGDILQFREDEGDVEVYAIHRVWLGRPWEKRQQRLASKDARQRRITKGCVNVSKETYAQLVDCCSTSTLIIK
jgi:hypothetical protein